MEFVDGGEGGDSLPSHPFYATLQDKKSKRWPGLLEVHTKLFTIIKLHFFALVKLSAIICIQHYAVDKS